MDTASHVLVGVTLAGLAAASDPAAAGSPAVLHAVMTATVVGSNAPDLDVLVRMKGKAAYIRAHRGVTHSLPALPVWAVSIGLSMAYVFGIPGEAWTIMLWSFVAVVCHVGLDLLNAYGVQCLRPITRKWLHLDVLCLFDPYLFGLHLFAAAGWLTGLLPPAPTFIVVYAASFLYMGWRFAARRRAVLRLRDAGYASEGLTLLPNLNGHVWHFAAETEHCYVTGRLDGGRLSPGASYPRRWDVDMHPAVKATLETDGVRAIRLFAERLHVQCKEHAEGYEVTWADIRFWHDHRLPFRTDVLLDRDMNVIRDRLGWHKKSWEPPFV